MHGLFSKRGRSSQPEILNILSTRELNTNFGDLKEAMGVIGYEVHYVDSDYRVEENLSDNKDVKLEALKQLQYTLKDGRTSKIPPLLKPHVSFYLSALRDQNIQGIFSPPTLNGVLFNSMLTHLASPYEQEETADDDRLDEMNDKYNTLIREASIFLAARQLKIPVFGSCHGAQLLWYMHGGDLYSIPAYSIDEGKEHTDPIIQDGSIMNSLHEDYCDYDIASLEDYVVEADYESDPEEEAVKDYEHNLMMAVSKEKWPSFNAKTHPIMDSIDTYFTLVPDSPDETAGLKPTLLDNAIIARSFEFPGCIATQWHPHAYVDTKSSIRYLREFGSQCLDYLGRKASPRLSIQM